MFSKEKVKVVYEIIKIEVRIGEVPGGFVGIIELGYRRIFHSDVFKTKEKAKKRTERSFWRMLHCSHDITFDTQSESYPIDFDGQNEVRGYQATCKKCGYIDYIYDDDI